MTVPALGRVFDRSKCATLLVDEMVEKVNCAEPIIVSSKRLMLELIIIRSKDRFFH